MDLRQLPFDQRVAKIQEIFRYANQPDVSLQQISLNFQLSEGAVQRLLSRRVHLDAINAAGVSYTKPSKKGPVKAYMLSAKDLHDAACIVNNHRVYEQAQLANPHCPEAKPEMHSWFNQLIKSLWRLKETKVTIFKGKKKWMVS
jgi:hypothetical protein